MKRYAESRELYPYIRLEKQPAHWRRELDVPLMLVIYERMLRFWLRWYMRHMDETYDYYTCEGP